MTKIRDSVYPFQNYADALLRRKDADAGVFADDPDWAALGLEPDVVLIEVGGVATAGNYRISVIPDPATGLSNPNTVLFPRVAETNAGIATGFVAALLVEIDDTLAPYYTTAAIATAAGTNYVALTLRQDAPGHTLSLVAPGAGTLIATPDGYFPQAATTSNVQPADSMGRTSLAVAFVAVDGSGVLPDDTGCTFTVSTVRRVERRSRYDSENDETPAGVTATTDLTTHPLHEEYRIPLDGGRFGIRIHMVANPPTGATGIEIWYRQVQQ